MEELARKAVELASERQALDVVMLDLRPVALFADYFVIMGAESRRHLQALREGLVEDLKNVGASPLHVEGTADSGWVLLDFSDVIVHIFGTEERDYYNLEQLWSKAPEVVRIL